MAARTHIDGVGSNNRTRELRPCPSIFEAQAATGKETNLVTGKAGKRAVDTVQGIRPRGRNKLAVFANERSVEALDTRPLKCEAILVSDPLFVDLGIISSQTAQNFAAANIHADRTTGSIVLGYRSGRYQVEGACAEAVIIRGQSANRADLNDIAREVRGECATRNITIIGGKIAFIEGADNAFLTVRSRNTRLDIVLFLRVEVIQDRGIKGANLLTHEVMVLGRRGATASSLKIKEGVARNFLTEAHAALTQDATLAVQQNLRGELQRLAIRALCIDEARALAAFAHCLVLQGAFAALVADWAIQRVVDQQEFHHAFLGATGNLGGVLSLDHHAWGDSLST